MMASKWPQSPVVVGGVGGSGTRIISSIMQQLGIYMGADLNTSEDNLWFSLLFRRTALYERAQQQPQVLLPALNAFSDLMNADQRLEPQTVRTCLAAALDHVVGRNRQSYPAHIWTLWSLHRVYKLMRWSSLPTGSSGMWGWKEPNTHLYLEHLADYFPQMKYIHVIRHGVDMAYSDNLNQLQLWGAQYDVSIPEQSHQLPAAALEYWIRANERAIQTGQALFGSRFLLLNFDLLCLHPTEKLAELIAFLDVPIAESEFKGLIEQIKIPRSIGRYREQDLSIFTEEQLEKVRQMGFEVIPPDAILN